MKSLSIKGPLIYLFFKKPRYRSLNRTLADVDRDGKLDRNEFIVAMYFIEEKLANKPLPSYLPLEFVPPNHKKISSS
jgi:hypothetical protein